MSIADLYVSGEDKLKRTFVLPKRILWSGDGAEDSTILLETKLQQIYASVPKVTKLTTEGGRRGAILLDFGSELVGSLELLVNKASNPKGVRLHMRFGESVSEAMTPIDENNATNDHATRDMSVLVTRWSQQAFGYTGYRFVYIELEDEETWVDIAGVRGILTLRDIPYLGAFECDNKRLEQIYQVSAYTVHLCMQNMLWDGVKRDRLVWIGDIHPEMLAIRSVFGRNEIVDEALKFIPETNPLPQTPNKHTTYGYWYLMILWDWYWYTGNEQLVMELKTYWKGLVEELLSLFHGDQDEYLNEEEFVCGFFIDWPTKGTEEAKAGVYALFRLALFAAARLSELAHENELQNRCEEVAELISKKKLPHNDRKQIVALLELADMIDHKEASALLTVGGGKGMSTFMSYYILSAVANTAGVDVALQMLEEYYGAMLDAGATTFWEDFDLEWAKEGARIDECLSSGEYDIHGDNGRFCYQGMRHSLCHGWSAGPAAFLPERVLGIQILEPGCKKLSVKPKLGDLTWARGTYPTPYGLVVVKVWREQEEVLIDISAPKEIEIIK